MTLPVRYPVADIFRAPQGEGHFTGYRMVFVRLAGCSIVDCRIRERCDEAPWKARLGSLTSGEIVDRVRVLRRRGRVCITGGEPSDHNLIPLVSDLREAGYVLHLETSGERYLEGITVDWLTVSPKTASYKQRHGNEMKLVYVPEWNHDPWSYICGVSDGTQFFHYYLQPLYASNGKPVNRERVLALVDDDHNSKEWAISEQRHKEWGTK